MSRLGLLPVISQIFNQVMALVELESVPAAKYLGVTIADDLMVQTY